MTGDGIETTDITNAVNFVGTDKTVGPSGASGKNLQPLPGRWSVYTVIHVGDALIALESLYRYLCKFHALGDRRSALPSVGHFVPALVVLLSLEFMPRRGHL